MPARYGRVYDSSSSSPASGLIVFGLVLGALFLVPILAFCGRAGGEDSPFTLSTANGPDSANVAGESASPEEAEALAAEEPTATPEPESAGEVYVVQPGDTLWDISNRFGVSVEAITEANDISDPTLLRVGQELVIPEHQAGVGGN